MTDLYTYLTSYINNSLSSDLSLDDSMTQVAKALTEAINSIYQEKRETLLAEEKRKQEEKEALEEKEKEETRNALLDLVTASLDTLTFDSKTVAAVSVLAFIQSHEALLRDESDLLFKAYKELFELLNSLSQEDIYLLFSGSESTTHNKSKEEREAAARSTGEKTSIRSVSKKDQKPLTTSLPNGNNTLKNRTLDIENFIRDRVRLERLIDDLMRDV